MSAQEKLVNLTETELQTMLDAVRDENRRHFRKIRGGAALVLAAVFPGLGHLFLWRVGYAILLAAAWITVSYIALSGLLDGERPVLWLIGLVVIWLGSMGHATLLSEED